MNDLNLKSLRGSYDFRVQEKKNYAMNVQRVAKQLETQEAQLLQRLQKTQQQEK